MNESYITLKVQLKLNAMSAASYMSDLRITFAVFHFKKKNLKNKKGEIYVIIFFDFMIDFILIQSRQ